MPYFFAFSLSMAFFYFAHSSKVKSKYISWTLFICSVLVISILAGLRAETIGTDVLVYGNIVFKLSGDYSSFFSFYNGVIDIFRLEPLYMFLNYIISRITTNPALFYFVLSFFINGFFCLSIYNLRNKINIDIAWCSYLLIFYGHTLNIMRQSLAISAMMVCFSYLFLKKEKSAFMFFIISCFSHYSSGMIIFTLVCGYFVIQKVKDPFKLLIIASSVGILVTIGIQPITQLLRYIDILPERYSIYLSGQQGAGISIQSIFLKIPYLILFTKQLLDNPKYRQNRFFIFLFLMLILDFLFYQLRITNVVFSRISFYFTAFQVISIPYLLNEFQLTYSLKKVRILSLLYLSYLGIIWYYQVVMVGINDIYPYHSEIIKNLFLN